MNKSVVAYIFFVITVVLGVVAYYLTVSFVDVTKEQILIAETSCVRNFAETIVHSIRTDGYVHFEYLGEDFYLAQVPSIISES